MSPSSCNRNHDHGLRACDKISQVKQDQSAPSTPINSPSLVVPSVSVSCGLWLAGDEGKKKLKVEELLRMHLFSSLD